eukprot:362220-Chlamydomonas_euryale.AAC.3
MAMHTLPRYVPLKLVHHNFPAIVWSHRLSDRLQTCLRLMCVLVGRNIWVQGYCCALRTPV